MDNLKSIIINMQKELIKKCPTLNLGGCVHFAYFFSKKLNSLKIPNQIVYLADNLDVSCTHCYILIEGIGFIDGHYTSADSFHIVERSIMHSKINKLNKIRLIKDVWNNTYNRSFNPTLSRIINKHFYGYRG